MPTESRKRSRSAISRTTRRAIARSVSVSSSASIQASAARAESVVYSWMLSPPTLTARLSGPQPRAVAGRARLLGHVALDPLALGLGVGLS